MPKSALNGIKFSLTSYFYQILWGLLFNFYSFVGNKPAFNKKGV